MMIKRGIVRIVLFGFAMLMAMLAMSQSSHSNDRLYRRYLRTFSFDSSLISEPQLIVYPTLAYSPETNWEFGASALQMFYVRNDTQNRLSEVNGLAFYTLENQYGIWLDHAIYGHRDKWFFLGRLRFQSFPLYYFGIGMNTSPRYQALVETQQIIIKERVLKKVKKDFFVGLELDYQQLSGVRFLEKTSEPIKLPRGSGGYTNFGLGLGIVYDNRHNVLNVRNGLFSELGLLHYNPAFISTYQFSSLFWDTRYFKTIAKNTVLATQLIAQANTGDVPFNQMALMGGESMMRGYYTGRFRDFNQIAIQAELRILPLPLKHNRRFGATTFMSTAQVFPTIGQIRANQFVLAGGAGLRYLIFPNKDVYTRLDWAATREGSAFYFFVGEAF